MFGSQFVRLAVSNKTEEFGRNALVRAPGLFGNGTVVESPELPFRYEYRFLGLDCVVFQEFPADS